MARQTKANFSVSVAKHQKALWLRKFIANHKKLTVFLAVVILILATVGGIKYNDYTNKLSYKDYAAIENAAYQAFRKAGANDSEKYEYCRYVAPEKYSSVGLYCGVEMVAYVPYETDPQAIEVAKTLEKEVKKLGSVISDMSVFYGKPSNSSGELVVTFETPLRKEQCNFMIASHQRARNITNLLPKRSEDNLISMTFTCSAESRGEYFPVIYRQGS